MRAGRVAGYAGGLALAVVMSPVLAGLARADDPAGEVRVLSGPGATSAITVRASPDVKVEDRTPGAQAATAPRGPASTGQTFAGEITLFLHPVTDARAVAIDVDDPVVSSVRVFPEPGGSTVTVFVRQPVTYSVSQPSAIGEIRVEVHTKTRPLVTKGVSRGGVARMVRPKPTGEREVAVDAESLNYDQQSNTLTARGGVTLTQGDTTLTADEVVYDRTNAVVEARGHVVMTDPQATVQGDFAHMNLDDEVGWVDTGTADLEPTKFQLRGGRINKQGGPQYEADEAVFSTCRCGGLESPSWSLGAKKARVNLQGAGIVHGLTLRVKDVPVLWLPYFVFPASNNRQTGFLMPRVGYSNRRGAQYEQPFYWAINKSTDLTVAIDVETKARVGALGEYRYVVSPETKGEFTAAYFNEQIRGPIKGVFLPNGAPATSDDVPENRFAFAGRHVQPFFGKSRFYLDVFAVSDDLFLREINTFTFSPGQDYALRSTRFTTSRTGVIKEWSQGLAWGEFAYYQDLVDPQEFALQKLPRLTAEHSIPFLDDHVVARLNGEAVHYAREEGYDGFRGDLGPELLLPFHAGRFLSGSVSGQLRETAYHLNDTQRVAVAIPDTVGILPTFHLLPNAPDLAQDRNRELAIVNGRVGTEASRVFDFQHLGLEKLKHTIEPEVQYLYVPQTGQDVEQRHVPCRGLPGEVQGVNCDVTFFSEGYLFDERDAINHRNFISYGFTTRLLGRPPTASEVAARTEKTPPLPAPADNEEHEEEEELPPSPITLDPNAVPAGISPALVQDFVGPPAPPASAGAPAAAPRELLRASVLQGYDVSRALVGDSHLSDVDLGLRLTPIDYLYLTYNSTVSLQDSKIRGMSVGAIVREPGWTPPSLSRYQSASAVGVTYRFVENNVNKDQAQGPEAPILSSAGVNEIDGSLYLRLGNYLGFTFISRYDLNDAVKVNKKGGPVLDADNQPVMIGPHFFERDYLFRFISRCNCWYVEAGVADKTNPDERLFRFQITLLGLGSFGRTPTGGNHVGFAPVTALGLGRPGVGPGGGRGY
jgi:LPS-assembly protein